MSNDPLQNPYLIESPCIKVCHVDEAKQQCRGCLRTMDEIIDWMMYSPQKRRAIMLALPARRGSSNTPGCA